MLKSLEIKRGYTMWYNTMKGKEKSYEKTDFGYYFQH